MKQRIVFLAVVMSCSGLSCLQKDPLYCDQQGQCANGQMCHVATRTCGGAQQAQSDSRVPATQTCNCPGDAECGAGQCDEQGKCLYKAAGTLCKSACVDVVLTSATCNDQHRCEEQPTQNCAPYKCQQGSAVCATKCGKHDDCVTESLCDLTLDPKSGSGACISPSDITSVPAETTINEDYYRFSPKTNKAYVRLVGAVYYGPIFVGKGDVTIVGNGSTRIEGTVTDQPIIEIGSGASARLQGLQLTRSEGVTNHSGAGLPVGIKCADATVTAVNTLIEKNGEYGVLATNCDLVMHRGSVRQNKLSGITTTGGQKLHLTNLEIAENGECTKVGGPVLDCSWLSTTGALWIKNAPQDLQINFLTIANNYSKYAILCDGSGPELTDSIVWGNTAAQQISGCTLRRAILQGASESAILSGLDPLFTATSNFVPRDISPAIDRGTDSPTTTVDRLGKPRKQGVAADLGAYEVK